MPFKDKASRNAHTRKRRAEDPVWAEKERVRKRIVPAGHRSKGVSTLHDADGAVLKEWVKTERKPDDPPAVPVEPEGMFEKKRSTMLDRQGKALVQWRSFETEKAQEWQNMWTACEAATKSYKGLADPTTPPPPTNDRLFTWYPIGDPHLGLLAWARETGVSFDAKIMVAELSQIMRMLVDRSPASKWAMLSQLGDFFHAEDDKQVTPTAGHKLDVDGRAGKVTEVGFALMRYLVDLLLTKHEIVEVHNARGNHDPYKCIALSLWLKAVYEKEPRVIIHDNNNPYFFREWGQNLWGIHHGDGAKPEQLPGIMSCHDRGRPWGRTQYRRWFTGHIHTDRARQFPGVRWESFENVAANDYWAAHKGYIKSEDASLDSLTFDIDNGLVSRQIVPLELAKIAIRDRKSLTPHPVKG